METTQGLLGSLNLMTLGIVLIVAIIAALWYFRKRENRHPMGKNEGMHTNLDKSQGIESDTAMRAKDNRR